MTTGEMARCNNREPGLLVLIGATATFVAITAGQYLTATTGTSVSLVGLVLVVMLSAFGSRMRWGVAVGLLAGGVLVGDYYTGLVRGLAAVAAGIVWGSLWQGVNPRDEWPRWFLQFGTGTLLSIVTFAATEAWLVDVSGRQLFWVSLHRTLLRNLPLAFSGVVLAWILSRLTVCTSWEGQGESLTVQSRIILSAVVGLWAGLGYFGSFLSTAASRVPPGVFGRRLSPVAEAFLRAAGPNGRWLVFAIGALSITILVVVIMLDSDLLNRGA